MRAVLTRVKHASVTIDGKTVPNSDLEWTLYPADASLATIKSGVITTKRVAYTHYVQVSAALKSDPSRYANFRLCIAPGVKKITVSAPTTYVDLSGSKTLQLKATCDPEDAITDVTWSSSSSKIATVDASGLVTARKTGKVTITATAKDGSKVRGRITLRVVSGVTGLTIEGAGSVAAGKSITLKAVMMPADATEKGVVWSVDCDKSIASISQESQRNYDHYRDGGVQAEQRDSRHPHGYDSPGDDGTCDFRAAPDD